ncbi:MAG: hypothetical protein JO108_02770 [Acidobacteriaceae bacterium]|nr:hypothetical protein [Acidobacteriaceae bacterium]
MSAAPAVAQVPLTTEGTQFWKDLTAECESKVEFLNRSLLSRGLHEEDLVTIAPGSELHISKSGKYCVDISARIDFCSWGPVISGAVRGCGAGDADFSAREFEFPIARDGDGSVVAIYDQGKSFSPLDLSCYLMQNLRRCYPNLTLPC